MRQLSALTPPILPSSSSSASPLPAPVPSESSGSPRSGPSVPGRIAGWIATSLAVAACAGCMSVGDDEVKPAPSRSTDRHGTAAEPDGGTVAGPGVAGGRQGRAGMDKADRIDADDKGKSASPSPSSSPSPSPDVSDSSHAGRPRPGAPAHPGGGRPGPSKVPQPPVQTPPQPPVVSPPPGPGTGTGDGSPDPDPGTGTVPSGAPSASPAADVRASAMRMGAFEDTDAAMDMGMRKEPKASPQLGPM
ncbi:hypothetical protein [Streptomyces sp. 150FB]|uniref:hypothetical protein n=1 Tax=Streptomyces sp. 150FB TaxID=1576605 RepID=UPI000A7F11D4|nr:hypothetical protein [Streptomyces sp. 150FB]